FREIGDRFGADVPVSGAVDNVPPQPYLSPIAARAIALILLRFWPLNPGLLVSHSSDGRPPAPTFEPGAGAAVHHVGNSKPKA
ncbi:MAG: hypothetical protein E6848_03095, partial [Bradyrhizobium sp.]|nr:hypothetical protein [Bradyrhizobium sp.]